MAPQQEASSLPALVLGDSRRRGFGIALGKVVDLPVVGLWIARIARIPNRIPRLTPLITRFHAWLLRRSGGSLRRSWLFAAGQPVISLQTVGRRSGELRSTAVACFVDDDDLAIAGMNLGKREQPMWALNLQAEPRAQITIRGRTIEVVAVPAKGRTRDRLWTRWLELQPSANAFQEIADREIPIFVLERAVGPTAD